MRERLNATSEQIIGAAIDVHRALGPGLLESAYEACLSLEFSERGLNAERQKPLPLIYRGVTVDCANRLDFVVNGEVIVELKSVEKLSHVHLAQMVSYLRISGLPLGLLLNFKVKWLLDEGVKRVVNDCPDR